MTEHETVTSEVVQPIPICTSDKGITATHVHYDIHSVITLP